MLVQGMQDLKVPGAAKAGTSKHLSHCPALQVLKTTLPWLRCRGLQQQPRTQCNSHHSPYTGKTHKPCSGAAAALAHRAKGQTATSAGQQHIHQQQQLACLANSHQVPLLQSAGRCLTAFAAAAQLAAAGLLGNLAAPSDLLQPAHAVLNSPNAQIPRSVDSALRRAIPAFNAEVKELQGCLEDITFKLRIPQRKPWGTMQGDVTKAQVLLSKRELLLSGTPQEQADYAATLADDIEAGLRSVTAAIDARDPDKTSLRANRVLRDVASLELVQAPGIPYLIPKEYASRPRLNGRAVVDVVIERPNTGTAFLTKQGGGLQPQAKLQLVIDGYSAPITAGNFIQNVQKGMYDNTPISSSYVSVNVGPPQPKSGTELPLEILPLGGYEPIYRSALDVASGELPVLPLSIYGAVAMAHPAGDSEGLAASDQFFLYKFDRSSSGLAGLAFDEGTFGVFGYVTQGAELLQQLASGDMIKQMVLISGEDRLQAPETPAGPSD